MIEVSKIAQIAAVDELVQRLHGEAVDIKPALARKADKALQVLGGTVRIGAAQRLHAADGTDTHLARRAADGTGRRDFIAALGPDDRDALRDDLVGLDDAKLGLAVLADAEALELADVAEACARDSRALELHRVKDRDRRDGRSRARPFDVIEHRVGGHVRPLVGKTRARRVMTRHAAGRCVVRVVVGDDKAVHGNAHLAGIDLFRPARDGVGQIFRIRVLALDSCKAHLVKIVHPRAPGADHFIRVDERERCECHVSLFHLVEIRLVERQRAGGEVAGVCVAVVRVLERVVDGLEICVGDGRLTAHDEVALVADFRGNTADGGGHIGDVRADGAVAARQNAREHAAVIRRHKRRAVELPREPNVALARPVLQFLDLFRLGERERGVLMRFLLPLAVHFVARMARHLRRAVRADIAGLFFECGQLVKQSVPLVVRHLLLLPAVVSVGGGVQPRYDLVDPDIFVHSAFPLSGGAQKAVSRCS